MFPWDRVGCSGTPTLRPLTIYPSPVAFCYDVSTDCRPFRPGHCLLRCVVTTVPLCTKATGHPFCPAAQPLSCYYGLVFPLCRYVRAVILVMFLRGCNHVLCSRTWPPDERAGSLKELQGVLLRTSGAR